MDNTDEKLTCGIYIRVSSDKQVEEGYSLEEQKKILLKRAEQAGYTVVDVFQDAGISAKDIRGRPAMVRLLECIKEGKIKVVLAWKLSRTFRNLKDQLEAMELMKKQNAFFDFASDGIINPNQGTGKLHAQILGMISEMERENIADNVYMGMAAAARSGQWMGGSPPYGYDRKYNSESKRGASMLVINPAEAEVVRRIFYMFVEENSGYKHICNTLNKEGVTTKQGKPFSIGTVSGIINNPVHCGYIRWGGHRKWAEKRRKGTVEPIIAKGVHEPIISEELYKRAEAIRLARGGKCERKYDCLNILTGILKCPECGAGMVLSRAGSKGKKITYYGCGAFHNKGSCVCHSNLVALDKINDEVLNRISRCCNDEVIIRGVLKKLNKEKNHNREGAELDKNEIESMLKQIQRDIQNLQQRFEADDSNIDVQEYKRRIRELRSNEEVYKTRLANLNATISHYSSDELYTIEDLKKIFSNLKAILKSSDVVELRTLLHLMVEKITIDPESKNLDKIHIKINPALTVYLGVTIEEEANKASSFSCTRKVLRFTL